jgi:hypothetical protein
VSTRKVEILWCQQGLRIPREDSHTTGEVKSAGGRIVGNEFGMLQRVRAKMPY